MSAYIKKLKEPQINNIMMSLKVLEKQGQTKPKISRWKVIVKIRAEIDKMETRRKT
jgi:hypothetical protein